MRGRQAGQARLGVTSHKLGKEVRALIVHGDAEMRAQLGRVLNRWWQAEAVGDAEAAVAAAKMHRPDLMLCELSMPGLDGTGLLSALRADGDLRDLPVILLSAWGIGESEAMGAILDNFDAERRAEQALRKSEGRLRAAAELVGLGCYFWDPRTNALECDDRIRAIWGLPAGSPVDYAAWRAGVHRDDLDRVETAIRRSSDPQGDGAYDIEYRVIGRDDGVQRWVWTRAQTQFEDGRPVGCYGVTIDITRRKLFELALERSVETRTGELTTATRQLRAQIEQREIAEAAVRQLQRLDAIGQITAGVAHDFNNLLGIVQTNVRLLSRKLRDSDDREGLDLIRAAAERGVLLIAQLLAFSRKARLEPRVVDLNARVAGMRRLLETTMGGRVHLELRLHRRLPPALVDPDQIELVILNLAINGRDAMPSGGRLAIETFRTAVVAAPARPEDPPPGKYVGIAVIDHGRGIPADVLPHIFEPFFTTKAPGKGSGLGLAQAFAFAKQSQGGVRIDTRIGEGTAVRLFLPIARARNSRSVSG